MLLNSITAMRATLIAIATASIAALAVAAPTTDFLSAEPNWGENQCSDIMGSPGPDRAFLTRMHQIASMLEWSLYKREDTAPVCTSKSDGSTLLEPVDITFISDLLSALGDGGALINDAALLSADDPRDRRYHLTCHRDDPTIELTISIEYHENAELTYYDYGDAVEVPRRTFLVYLDVGLAIPGSLRPDDGLPEEIEAKIVQTNNGNGHSEQLFLVRGTDRNLEHVLSQLKTSVNGIEGDSCAFKAAALVVSYLSKRADHSGIEVLTVAGTSLGGGAAQHVAFYQQEDPDSYPSRFQAHSFNGIGLPKTMLSTYTASPDLLHSYSINGDIFMDGLRLTFDQEEAGVTYRYRPQDVTWRTGKRHSIYAVLDSLCRCANKKGELVVE